MGDGAFTNNTFTPPRRILASLAVVRLLANLSMREFGLQGASGLSVSVFRVEGFEFRA